MVLQRLPDSVVGVLELELAGAHQRMRDAQVATIQAERGLQRMTVANHKLVEAVAAAEGEMVRDRNLVAEATGSKLHAATAQTPRHPPETPRRAKTPRAHHEQQNQEQQPAEVSGKPRKKASRGGGSCCSRPN